MNGIYCYLDKETDKIVYIGKDSYIDKDRRHKQHMSKSNRNAQKINQVIQNNPDRYKYSRIIEGEFDTETLNDLEIHYIRIIDPALNFTPGGDGLGSGENNPRFRSDLDDTIIIDMYVNQGLNSYEIAEKLNTNHHTILDRLRNNNIEIRSKCGEEHPLYRNDLDDNEIIYMYVNKGLSSYEIAKKLNTNPSTILDRLRNNNIERRSTAHYGENHPRFRSDLDDDIIIEWYNQGLSIREIAKKLNTNNSTIWKRLKKNNIEIRSNSGENNPAYRSDLDDEIIIDMYVNQGLSIREIAKKLNTHGKTIWRRLKKNNIEIRSNSGEEHPAYRHDLNDDVIIYMYVNKGLSSNEIAKKLNTNQGTIWKRLKKNNVERRSTAHYGEEHPNFRDDIPDGKTLKKLYDTGYTYQQIADIFQCSRKTISNRIKKVG